MPKKEVIIFKKITLSSRLIKLKLYKEKEKK